MGIGTSTDGAENHARQIEVIRLPRLSCDLGDRLMSGIGLAYNLKWVHDHVLKD
jgi:hypothetical protein